MSPLMDKVCKLLAILGILWAALMPAYLWHRNTIDEQYRRLRAIAAVGPGGPEAAAKQILSNLADAEARREAMFMTAACISSAVVLVLAVCILEASRKHRRTIAEPVAPPNGDPAGRLGNSAVADGPPSVS